MTRLDKIKYLLHRLCSLKLRYDHLELYLDADNLESHRRGYRRLIVNCENQVGNLIRK